LNTALAKYGINLNEITVVDISPENYSHQLELGEVDAILVYYHPDSTITRLVSDGIVRIYPWTDASVREVASKFPGEIAVAYLPANTYEGQSESILGYASTKEIPEPVPAPTPLQEPVPAEPQKVHHYMRPGAAIGKSVTYTKSLDTGDEISAFVQLDEPYPRGSDYSYYFYVKVIDEKGGVVKSWQKNWERNNTLKFSLTVSTAGEYTITVTHHSNYPKRLYMELSPPGWGCIEWGW